MNIQEQIDRALQGLDSEATIYWDTQDPNNTGPAFRCGDTSGALEFHSWQQYNGLTTDHIEGYCVADYFDHDGRYLGLDVGGVYPILTVK